MAATKSKKSAKKQQYLVLPIDSARKARIRAAAKHAKLSMSAWMRKVLDRAA